MHAAAAAVSAWQVMAAAARSAHYLARIHGKMFMGSSQCRGDSGEQRQPDRPLRLISFHEEQLQLERISQGQQLILVVRGAHAGAPFEIEMLWP